ncbi:MAG TPA: STAS domain-containing protein [Streptosporangiaceae bacterium]|nr:STAS domain-containing protein [Streptosporangiaceae bacterium]
MEPGTAIAPDLSVSTWTANGVTIAELSGELVTARAPDLRDGLVRSLQSGSSQIIVDLSRVTDCDERGLAVLVGVEHRARAAGGFLRLAAAPPPVQRVLGVTGLHLHLGTFPTIQAAISGPGGGSGPRCRSGGSAAARRTSGQGAGGDVTAGGDSGQINDSHVVIQARPATHRTPC